METGRFVSICSRMKSFIQIGQAEIKAKEGLISDLRTRIETLRGEPFPDQTAIQSLEIRIAALEAELTNDRLQQQVMEEEYLAECT